MVLHEIGMVEQAHNSREDENIISDLFLGLPEIKCVYKEQSRTVEGVAFTSLLNDA